MSGENELILGIESSCDETAAAVLCGGRKVLSMAEYYGKYPCHRVVNSAGRLAPGFYEQRSLLENEGVGFKENGCVDMKKHGWNGE